MTGPGLLARLLPRDEAAEPVNPGPLLAGTRAWGRVESHRDFLNGVSVRVLTGGRRIRSTATLRLYAARGGQPLRESRRPTDELDDGDWQLFPFESIRESDPVAYRFSIETDAEDEAVALAPGPGGEPVDARVSHAPALARVFDPWLARDGRSLPPVPPHLERYLDRHVDDCIKQRRYVFLRLAHLADAVGRIPETLRDVLSIGSGAGYHEAFLAGRLPDLRILATDIAPPPVEFPMPNLAYGHLDLLATPPSPTQYDLVYSIECLEHLEDARAAFRGHALRVRPGKYLFVTAPFASRAEQKDPDLRRVAWEQFEHWTPGFSFEDLEEMFEENGFDVLHASNMFYLDVELPMRRILDALSAAELEAGSGAIARLMQLDVRSDRVASAKQAEGIRFLGRRRG